MTKAYRLLLFVGDRVYLDMFGELAKLLLELFVDLCDLLSLSL